MARMTNTVKIVPRPPKLFRARKKTGNVVAVLAYDGVNAFELGMAIEVFGLSKFEPHSYRVVICATEPRRRLSASGGIALVADAGLEALKRASTIIVPGWQNIAERPPESLLTALKKAHARGARIASICSGAFVLAAAGLLDGRTATTHWANVEALAQRYPRVRVEPDVLYIDDGDVLTSAGLAAGLDLCLHIVRRDHGAEIANRVARRLVIAPHRDGGQAQFIQRPLQVEGDPLKPVLSWAQKHVADDLSVEALAERARMSRRTFIRRFGEIVGTTPGEWVLHLRLDRARGLLEASRLTIDQVAAAVGFGSTDALRHHFRQRLYISPARYRSSFRGDRRPAGGR